MILVSMQTPLYTIQVGMVVDLKDDVAQLEIECKIFRIAKQENDFVLTGEMKNKAVDFEVLFMC